MEEEYEPEVWVDLKDDLLHNTEDKYSISSYGRVYNKEKGVFVSPVSAGLKEKNNNYWYVNLYIGGVVKLRRVHYLQAYSFFGKPPKDDAGSVKKQTCDHIDRNRFNNALWNLRWLDRKGQSANRNERKDTLLYTLKTNYPNKEVHFGSSIYSFFQGKLSQGLSYKEVDWLYNQKEHLPQNSTLGEVVLWKNTYNYFNYLCDVFGKDINYSTMLYNLGYTLPEIFLSWIVPDVTITGYEVEGVWYPSKASVQRKYNLAYVDLDLLLKVGSLKSYTKEKRRLDDTRKYTKILQTEQVHGKDWGDGIFGTIRGLARKYKIDQGTLWCRVNKYKMTMKEALELPEGNITHYLYINGKWYLKAKLYKDLGVKRGAVTQRMRKGDELKYALLSLKGVREVIFNINGNIYSKMDIVDSFDIPCKYKRLQEDGETTFKELFTKLNIITDQDYFEVIKRESK